MNKLRVSYTLIDLWERKRYDDMVNFYLKLKDITETDAILEGKAWDDIIEQEVIANMKLPDQFGGMKFKEMPTLKPKLECDINDEIEMVCVPDMLAPLKVLEFKTGSSKSANEYLNSGQVDMYALACFLLDVPIEKLIVIRYNQHTRTYEWAFKWVSKTLIEETKKKVETVGHEIAEYLRGQGLM